MFFRQKTTSPNRYFRTFSLTRDWQSGSFSVVIDRGEKQGCFISQAFPPEVWRCLADCSSLVEAQCHRLENEPSSQTVLEKRNVFLEDKS